MHAYIYNHNSHVKKMDYRKSSNNSPGAYLPTNIFWVGAYSNEGLINLEEL